MTSNSKIYTSKLITLIIHANQLRGMRDYQQALQIYHDVIEQYGETVDLDQVIAYCYFQLGLSESDEANYRLAVVWAKKAISLAPTNSHLYDLLGELHLLGTLEYQEAAQAYRKAIELNPNNVRALVGGAALYGVPEDVVPLDEAINWLEYAVQIEPKDPNYHLNLGILYHEVGQVSKAKTEWLKALVCPRPLDVALTKTIIKLIGTGI